MKILRLLAPALLGGSILFNTSSTALANTCEPLNINRGPGDGNVTLSWPGPCGLQQAPEATGPWNNVPGSSPWTVVVDRPKAFFRTVSPEGACSPNVAGYVKQVISSSPSGGLRHLLANPLYRGNNHLNTILPLPGAYDGTFIQRFDVATQNFGDPIIWFAFGLGWFSQDPNEDYILNPGEGFFIEPVGPNRLNVIWVGEVPQGTLVNPLPPPNAQALRSSIAPQSGLIGTTLAFPAEDGDAVELFDSATQTFNQYQYFFGVWGPSEPVIPVGTGFFIQKSQSAIASVWTRNLVVSACAGCPAGLDLFTTPGGGTTCQVFPPSAPIPAGFFDPGSVPFEGTIVFQGEPLSTQPPNAIFPTDTIVQRLAPANPTSCGSATVPIEIVALCLVSTSPITVHYQGGATEQWNVRATLSSTTPQSQGNMTITADDTGYGGTFTAALPVKMAGPSWRCAGGART